MRLVDAAARYDLEARSSGRRHGRVTSSREGTWRRRRWRSTASRRDRSSRRVSMAVRSAPAVAYWRGVTIWHLLQDSVDALPGARAHLDVLDLPTPDEAA